MMRRGIVLAGGTGTRLFPMTLAMSKQLLPVYDKPMVHYAIATLIRAGIREVLVIATPHDLPRFRQLLGDGSAWGMVIGYAEQPEPRGIAEALVIARAFLDGRPSVLILGDNLFHGDGLDDTLGRSLPRGGATAFACRVRDPRRYGVIELDADGRPVSIEEKPGTPRSPFAVTGLYLFDADGPDVAAQVRPSARGLLEITDVLDAYRRRGALAVEILGTGTAWLDAGTPESLQDAAAYVRTIEERTGAKLGCPEEAAWRAGFINTAQLLELARRLGDCAYADYLRGLTV